ncbi:MAG: hypothetical protein KAV44_04505, partial [Bacteroidales bacterium]|nr:hypothetical protein [Bacteroidales bacterium]
LDKTGEALVKGIPIPSDIQKMISKPPIPLMTFGIWRWMFLKVSRQSWKRQAIENGISEEKMYAKPYAD